MYKFIMHKSVSSCALLILMAHARPMLAQNALTGFHVGVLAGYAQGTYQSATTAGIDHEPRGGLLGGQAGWSARFGSLIVGVDGDLAFTTTQGDDAVNVSGFQSDVSSEINFLGTLRGRLGGMAGPALIYGTAGFAMANVDNLLVVSNAAGEVGRDSERSRHTGWVAGAGVEYPITSKVSIDAKYLYIDMADEEVTMNIGAFPFTDKGDLNLSTFRVGINLRF